MSNVNKIDVGSKQYIKDRNGVHFNFSNISKIYNENISKKRYLYDSAEGLVYN